MSSDSMRWICSKYQSCEGKIISYSNMIWIWDYHTFHWYLLNQLCVIFIKFAYERNMSHETKFYDDFSLSNIYKWSVKFKPRERTFIIPWTHTTPARWLRWVRWGKSMKNIPMLYVFDYCKTRCMALRHFIYICLYTKQILGGRIV